MKVLVATKEGQGVRQNDFFFCKEGELVMFGFDCDGESVNGSCGCRRSLVGVESSKATTTFKVARIVNMTKQEVADKFYNHLQKNGWIDVLSEEQARLLAEKQATNLLRIASSFKVGEVLERRGSFIYKRELSSMKLERSKE